MEVLANTLVVIILHCINAPNQHIVHVKLTNINYTSIFKDR